MEVSCQHHPHASIGQTVTHGLVVAHGRGVHEYLLPHRCGASAGGASSPAPVVLLHILRSALPQAQSRSSALTDPLCESMPSSSRPLYGLDSIAEAVYLGAFAIAAGGERSELTGSIDGLCGRLCVTVEDRGSASAQVVVARRHVHLDACRHYQLTELRADILVAQPLAVFRQVARQQQHQARRSSACLSTGRISAGCSPALAVGAQFCLPRHRRSPQARGLHHMGIGKHSNPRLGQRTAKIATTTGAWLQKRILFSSY